MSDCEKKIWSFLGILIAPWHHPKLCQEPPCLQTLHKDQTFLTHSLSMSLKSFPWVFENMDVPKNVQDDVWWLGEPQGSFIKKFHNRTSGSTLKNTPNSFLAPGPPKLTCWIQKVSIPIYFIHGTRWCIQKKPNFTHLENEHFFWDTLYIKSLNALDTKQRLT